MINSSNALKEDSRVSYAEGYTHIVQIYNGDVKQIKASKRNRVSMNDYFNQYDIYYTPNTFNSKNKRTSEYLWQLNNLYIDIDHKQGTGNIEHDILVSAIEKMADNKHIPYPTKYVNSGRGLHVYWNIGSCHVMLLDLWRKIENYLYESLKTLESEFDNIEIDRKATDPTRLLRVPGTRNSKNYKKCYEIKRRNKRYNLLDIKKEYIQESTKKGTRKEKVNNLVYLPTKNLMTLNNARMKDIRDIVKLRNGDVTGHRNMILLLYSYHYRLNYDVSLDKLIEATEKVNQLFKSKYPSTQLKAICKSVDKVVTYFRSGESERFYRFTNTYIIDSLGITGEEMQQLKTIISTGEKNKRHNTKKRASRRNEEGLTAREKQKEEVINNVKVLKEKGYKQIEIAKELNISKGRVSQIIKDIKKV